MTGDVTINGVDAYARYGVNFESGALSALMTPPPTKDFIETNSRMVHGRKVITKNPRYDSREITLTFHLIASTKDEFLEKYQLFCDEVLAPGAFELKTRYQPQRSVIENGQVVTKEQPVYRLIYVSCSQFRQYMREMAVFSLRVSEPDPTNRGTTDKNA
jgi:hypothetical protein